MINFCIFILTLHILAAQLDSVWIIFYLFKGLFPQCPWCKKNKDEQLRILHNPGKEDDNDDSDVSCGDDDVDDGGCPEK